MPNFTVQNIFQRLSFSDLCITANDPTVIHVRLQEGERILRSIQNSNANYSITPVYLIFGAYSVMLFQKDVIDFVTLFGDSAEKFVRSNPIDLKQIGYTFLDQQEIENFDPPSGHLYNFLNSNKALNVIIKSKDGMAIGLTNFDIAVDRIRRRVERYY